MYIHPSIPSLIGEIQKHFDGFGLEPQFAQHTRMNALSGGQKVKVSYEDVVMIIFLNEDDYHHHYYHHSKALLLSS